MDSPTELLRDYEAVSVDLFGTLVSVDRPDSPATAIAEELDCRGIDIPENWSTAYRESHLEVKQGAELPLSEHVTAALASRDESVCREEIQPPVGQAVEAAFAVDADPRPGAERAVEELAARRPVAVLSNCAVSGLAEHALDSAGLPEVFEAVVTSVDCGWRKPDRRAFAAAADELGVEPDDLLHVGDKPETDGEFDDGSSVIVGDGTLAAWRDQWG